MEQIAIYGIGKITEYFLVHHDFTNEEIVAYIETDKKHDLFRGIQVIEPAQIDEKIGRIYITNSSVETLEKLLELGVEKNKIIICSMRVQNAYVLKNKGKNDICFDEKFSLEFNQYFENVINKPKYVVSETMNKYIDIFECENVQMLFGEKYILTEDYCRYGTLRLLMEEINDNNIVGDLAELGVYRDDFSKYMNKMFPNRKLYLFDTYEGFDDRDMDKDIKEGFTSKEWFDSWDNFSNTYVELVMSKMLYKEQCIVRKGYFPETIPEEEIQYALVSLDCDLYEPILSGLRYFYPRLSEGGYIMLHDYNQSDHLSGVKKAVKVYEKEIGKCMNKVPIPDVCGTLVITR